MLTLQNRISSEESDQGMRKRGGVALLSELSELLIYCSTALENVFITVLSVQLDHGVNYSMVQ